MAATKAMLVEWDGGSWYFGDITRAENHRSVLKITEHAVEDGPDVTDSARREVDKFACEVLVSNTPLVNLNYSTTQQTITIDPDYYHQPIFTNLVGAGVDALKGLIFGQNTSIVGVINAPNVPFDAVADMRSLAIWLQDTKQLLTVTTAKATYQNMLLEVSELNRQAKDGDAASFRFEFKRVRVVQVGATANMAPVPPRGNAPVTQGKQGAQQQPTVKNSAFAQAVQDAGGHTAGTTFGGP